MIWKKDDPMHEFRYVNALNLESGGGIIQGGGIRWKCACVMKGGGFVCCEEESCGLSWRTCPKQTVNILPYTCPSLIVLFIHYMPLESFSQIVLWSPPHLLIL